MEGWRQPGGAVVLGARGATFGAAYLALPCGSCLGCRFRVARDWSIRCHLEASEYDRLSWCTLTYDESCVPPSLDPWYLSGFMKRLRARLGSRRFRFFGCGEYGEQFGRPHYHAILFGLDQADARAIDDSWPFGFVRVDQLLPAAIHYVCGYTVKKAADRDQAGWYPDPDTGEELFRRKPFIQMSRRPFGIGGAARIKYPASWRSFAVSEGVRVPVPRYLHQAWLDSATEVEVSELAAERAALPRISPEQLEAARLIAAKRLKLFSKGSL